MQHVLGQQQGVDRRSLAPEPPLQLAVPELAVVVAVVRRREGPRDISTFDKSVLLL